MKEFKGLLNIEIKKAENVANKYSGFNDCKVTGYSYSIEKPFDFDSNCTFINVVCEICRNYEERCEFDVRLTIPMFDRRNTKAEIIK